MSQVITHQKYLELVEKVNQHRQNIHLKSQENDDSVSEQILDQYKHLITIYELNNPDKISPQSPNQIVAGGVLPGFEKFNHLRRMVSLIDIFDFEELEEWETRWKNFDEKT